MLLSAEEEARGCLSYPPFLALQVAAVGPGLGTGMSSERGTSTMTGGLICISSVENLWGSPEQWACVLPPSLHTSHVYKGDSDVFGIVAVLQELYLGFGPNLDAP